jgi:hypothetical protein
MAVRFWWTAGFPGFPRRDRAEEINGRVRSMDRRGFKHAFDIDDYRVQDW